LRRGEHVPLGELLHMSLMSSDNCATRVIAIESGLAPAAFVARMNQKAVELGLTGARFVEFTGLDEHNVATASDVARTPAGSLELAACVPRSIAGQLAGGQRPRRHDGGWPSGGHAGRGPQV